MRKYTLASTSAKNAVDLREYKEDIIKAVHQIMPKSTVVVEENCYYVSPTPSQGSAIKIGRLICQSNLKNYCIQIPKLFSSIEIEEAKNEPTQQKRLGGHQ